MFVMQVQSHDDSFTRVFTKHVTHVVSEHIDNPVIA
jgi:hypothetical protein